MKNKQRIIRFGRNIPVLIISLTMISFILALIIYLLQLEDMKSNFEHFYFIVAMQTFGQLKTTWNIIMNAISFLGGIQILILLYRNRRKLHRFAGINKGTAAHNKSGGYV